LSIRIYVLAKQLKLDNKALVDICNALGIAGKGSALASLSDEEVALLKAHLSGQGKKSGSPATSRSVAAKAGGEQIRREDYIAPGATVPKKVPVLAKKPEVLPPKTAEVPLTEAAPEAPLETPPEEPVIAELVPEPPAEVVQEAPPEPVSEPPVEEPPEAKKPAAPERPERKLEPPKAPPEKQGPTIKLAPMPTPKQPPGKRKSDEPAPQKPEIRLPPDAIRASKAGSTPLSEHIRKQEEKRKAAEKKTGPKQPPKRTAKAKPGEEESPVPAKDRGRRGKQPVKAGEGDAVTTLGGREQRQLKRKRTVVRRRGDEDEGTTAPIRNRRLRRTGTASTAAPRKNKMVLTMPCTVRAFAEALGLPAQQVQAKLLEFNMMLPITASLNAETAELLAEALQVEVEIRQHVDLEERLIGELEQEDDPASLEPRPPVVTFLGHVDHGKTSLLDRIIGIDVVSGEKGGITQHIRAYQIKKGGRPIAFVDTPGHEAFTAMRARGANCTDIAVLVIAADDGVMPQTEEAISHARAAGVPIVVALNKIDLPGLNVDRVLDQLARNDLMPSEWGGDTELVRTSAATGEGIDVLLETLLTVAELHEYKANPDRPASGICLEAEVQQGRGVIAKILVQRGTLRVGDVVVCGAAHGRIKAMYDTLNPRKRHKETGPSMPVNVTGLDVAPGAGARFHVLDDVSEARQIAQERAGRERQHQLAGVETTVTLENLRERLESERGVRTQNIILRADVRGSIEAIGKELTKLEHPEVQIKILQASVGGITEADVELANASDAVIIGFNVVPDENARSLSEKRGVQIRRYDIIYQVTEDLRAALEGMLEPERREMELGRALVQQTFHISRLGTVAGCRVLSGTIQRDSRVRVIRDSRVIGDYPLDTLRREKDDAKEVREGYECGIKLNGFNDIKEGDILEAYKIEEVARTF
jgi:translation initiation factor IF-2